MRNANNCPKKPYSVVVRGVDSDLEYVSGTKSPQKVLPISIASPDWQRHRSISVTRTSETTHVPQCVGVPPFSYSFELLTILLP